LPNKCMHATARCFLREDFSMVRRYWETFPRESL
jgi:hypothetical protein